MILSNWSSASSYVFWLSGYLIRSTNLSARWYRVLYSKSVRSVVPKFRLTFHCIIMERKSSTFKETLRAFAYKPYSTVNQEHCNSIISQSMGNSEFNRDMTGSPYSSVRTTLAACNAWLLGQRLGSLCQIIIGFSKN